jgi:hypothetical protein
MGFGRYVAVSSAAAFAILTVGCGQATFTRAVRDRYGLSAEDVGRLQFSTSEEIVLQREISVQKKERRGSELAIEDGVRIEQIVIPAHTPGVALEVVPSFILVSFSRQTPGHALWFGLGPSGPDDGTPTDTRPFLLATLENEPVDAPPFAPRWSKGFLVTWGGEKYRVAHGRGAFLTYDMDESFASEKVKQQPPGWRLTEGVPAVKTPPTPPTPSVEPAPSGAPLPATIPTPPQASAAPTP